MDNLSQNDISLNIEPENNQNQSNSSFIPMVYNNFGVIGMILNDIQKKTGRGYLYCVIQVAVPGGTILNLFAFGKLADEIATIYKKGDMVAFRGNIKSKIIDEKLNSYLLVKEHLIVKKNLNLDSINDHEFYFKKTQQLYDPFEVKKRMIKEDNNDDR